MELAAQCSASTIANQTANRGATHRAQSAASSEHGTRNSAYGCARGSVLLPVCHACAASQSE